MNPAQYVRDTVDLVKQIETRFLELGARLYAIHTKELWKATYDSYQEFLDVCRVNPSMDSILRKIHRHYIVEGGKKMETLAGIGYSNLYEAIPLIEKRGVDGAIIAADTLTRADIKDTVRDQKHGRHEHEVGTARWGMCDKCGKFVRIDGEDN